MVAKQVEKINILPLPFDYTIAFHPAVKSVLGKNLDPASKISAEAAIVMDDTSKVVLFSKKSNLRFSTASTAKIMTALVALDHFNLDDALVIKDTNIEGVVFGGKSGERFYFLDLLYAMLLPSGNDAALAVAQNYIGGEEEFVKKMNQKAKDIYLLDTHFADSTGLTDEGDYTTAFDLALLSSFAIKNKIISEIVSTRKKTIASIEGNVYEIENLNKLLGYYGVDGIKTGFTYEAEGVLSTSTIVNGRRLIIVVMKSKDRFYDTQILLEAYRDIKYQNIAP